MVPARTATGAADVQGEALARGGGAAHRSTDAAGGKAPPRRLRHRLLRKQGAGAGAGGSDLPRTRTHRGRAVALVLHGRPAGYSPPASWKGLEPPTSEPGHPSDIAWGDA